MPDDTQESPSILTRVLKSFKGWLPSNNSKDFQSKSDINDELPKSDLGNQFGFITSSPVRQQEIKLKDHTEILPKSRSRNNKKLRPRSAKKVLPKPNCNSLPDTISREAPKELSLSSSKTHEDINDYSILLKLLAPRHKDEELVEEPLKSHPKLPSQSPMKRGFQLEENDIKDITETRSLPSKKKIKVSNYSVRILPSDDEMEVDYVDLDESTKPIEAETREESADIEKIANIDVISNGHRQEDTDIETENKEDLISNGATREGADLETISKADIIPHGAIQEDRETENKDVVVSNGARREDADLETIPKADIIPHGARQEDSNTETKLKSDIIPNEVIQEDTSIEAVSRADIIPNGARQAETNIETVTKVGLISEGIREEFTEIDMLHNADSSSNESRREDAKIEVPKVDSTSQNTTKNINEIEAIPKLDSLPAEASKENSEIDTSSKVNSVSESTDRVDKLRNMRNDLVKQNQKNKAPRLQFGSGPNILNLSPETTSIQDQDHSYKPEKLSEMIETRNRNILSELTQTSNQDINELIAISNYTGPSIQKLETRIDVLVESSNDKISTESNTVQQVNQPKSKKTPEKKSAKTDSKKPNPPGKLQQEQELKSGLRSRSQKRQVNKFLSIILQTEENDIITENENIISNSSVQSSTDHYEPHEPQEPTYSHIPASHASSSKHEPQEEVPLTKPLLDSHEEAQLPGFSNEAKDTSVLEDTDLEEIERVNNEFHNIIASMDIYRPESEFDSNLRQEIDDRYF